MRGLWIAVGAVALSLGSAGVGYRCGKARAEPGSAALTVGGGQQLATFDDQRLGEADLRTWLEAEGPGANERLKSEAVRKQYVEGWARMQLLAHRAQTSGLADSPEERRDRVRRLASLYVEKNFEEPERHKPVTDEEARAYFEAHRADYAHPETFELAEVFFKGKDGAARTAARAHAQRALRDLARELPKQPYAFETLARQQSEDLVSAANGGRLAPMTREQLTQRFGEKSAATVAGLSAGAAPVLVEGEDGVRLLRLLRHDPAVSPSFETLAASIKGRIRVTRREPDYQAFLSQVEKDAHLHIDNAAVDALFTNGAKKR